MPASMECPAQDCTGRVEVELEVRSEGAKANVIHVHPTGFRLLGEHNHPDPWTE